MAGRARALLVVAVAALCAGICLGVGYWFGRTAMDRTRSSSGSRVWIEDEGSQRSGEPRRQPTLPSFAPAVERTSPGVVAVRAIVTATKTPTGAPSLLIPVPEEGPEVAKKLAVRDGSGFVVNQKGLVVTARHLTVRALRLVVDVPGLGSFDAQLVGEDDVTDLAVLRISDPPPTLSVLELGNSEHLRAGDWIVAVGNPYGFRQSVTAGIVSYVGRHLSTDDLRPSSEFLQFSAAVNPGSSGCPVVDLDGRVVGVTTQAAESAQGLSFAIPSRTLKWVLDAMDKSPDGRVHRGQMGISLRTRTGTDDRGQPLRGVEVGRVLEGQPAHRAGIEPGDIVIAVDGTEVVDTNDLHERITRSPPGTALRVQLQRDGRTLLPLSVVLGDAAQKPPSEVAR